MSGWGSKAAALAALLVLTSAHAAAQTTTPADEPAVGPPVILAPPGQGTGSATPEAAQPPTIDRAPSGIEVDPLGEVATDYGGTLEPATGGLPIDMWRGTDRAFVERLLPQLPAPSRSPVLRGLARRLLLSSAASPAGPQSLNLIAVRADRLIALGDREAAGRLLALLPEGQRSAATEQMRLEAAWLAGRDEEACAEVANLIRRFDKDLYFQKALIFCQAKAGQNDEASLGLDLLREQGHADEGSFADLVGVLIGLRSSATVEALEPPKGLNYALLRAAGQDLPDSAATDPDLLSLKTREAPAELAASEEAVMAGLLEPQALARAYAAESVTPAELAGAVDLAPDIPHARAVLFQAATRATDANARASLIHKALSAARQAGPEQHLAMLRVYLPLIEQLDPAPWIAAMAGDAGRALYLGGRYELAAAWLDVAKAASPTNPEAAAAVPALSFLAHLAGADDPDWNAATVAAWLQAHSSADDGGGRDRAARLFALMEGLGKPSAAAWQVLAEPRAAPAEDLPDPALLFALRDAGRAKRVGETVMLSLFVLSQNGPGASHPLALAQALTALSQAGLETEARAIAFETAIVNGL